MHHAPQPATLADVLLSAASRPSPHALVSVHRDGSETSVSYPDLLTRARGLLAALQAQGLSPGQTVLVQVGAGARQIELFWACALGGMVPVLLPKVAGWRRESEASRRLRAVCSLFDRAVLLIDEDQHTDYTTGTAAVPPGMRWLCDPGQADAAQARAHPAQPSDLAYLQLSSGSTGVPKGVRLTHANMLANLRDMALSHRLRPEHGFLNWMPYYHDMGLVMFHLLPAYLGAGQVKLDATDFVADPLLWLAKIHQHRSAVVGGPNFGLRHVLDKLDGRAPDGVDLSCVRQWFNGAEPIWVPTLREFTFRMATVGLRPEAMTPAYGLAEATVVVSFSPLGTRALAHRLDRQALLREGVVRDAAGGVEAIEYADVGVPMPSTQVRIAGEDGADLGEERLGEVQIRGDSVTAGYETQAGNAQRELFTADGWLRTGDLGFLRHGRLTITGRLKDVIFIHGRNVMAVDVEQHLSQNFELKTGRIAACGVAQADGTEAVALFVVARTRDADWQLLHQIRAAAETYLSHPVACALPVRRLPHTSSGKLQRYQLARQWQLGEFDDLLGAFNTHGPQAPSRAEADPSLVELVAKTWAETLRLRPADVCLDTPFTALGGSSLHAIQALALLEKRLGHRLGTGLLADCRTVRETVAYLERDPAPEAACAASAQPQPQPQPQPPANASQAIAVIGMACRFPGAASPTQFWHNLRDGVSSIRDVPAQRWTIEGKRTRMGCLDGVDLFAADFFGVGAEEARVMDPQQRLMLEAGYEALEDAGYTGARMPASRRVGVYVSAIYNTYLEQITERRRQGGFAGAQHGQLLPANLLNVIAARIAQSLDLKGPALNIDTACSSSLVGPHYACADLLSGQCEMALAGGVCLLTSPSMVQLLDQAGTLSAQGASRPFDQAADGLVAAEGLGLVVLKRLDKALADGDRIDAVLSAIAINNDGRSIGLMAPTIDGQQAVVRQALETAGLAPTQLSYVEAHGTGTPVGDAVELHALAAALGEPTGTWRCGIGSVKSNIGHPMAASGVAGLIKLLLSLRHDCLPPTLNLREPQAQLRLANTPLRPLLSATPWPRGATPRHAGISSFGFGGTNAHAIVSDGPVLATPAPAGRTHHLLCLSARNREELLAARARLLEHLLQEPDLPMIGLSYTTCLGRAAFELREYLVVSDQQNAIEQLRQGAQGRWPGAPAAVEALHTLGRRWVDGESIDWAPLFHGSGARIVPLPTYPFSRQSYWLPNAEAPASAPLVHERSSETETGSSNRLAGLVSACFDDAGDPSDGRLQQTLDRLCAALLDETLARAGAWAYGPATLDQLAERLQVRADRRAHLRRLLDIAASGERLIAEGGRYRRRDDAPPTTAHAIAQGIVTAYPFAQGAVHLLQRSVEALVDVWAGRRFPVEVLFSGDSMAELGDFYQHFPPLTRANAMVAAAIRQIAAERPRFAPAVLEIGAGTGSLTAAVVPALREFARDYVYTDISRRFLVHGQQRFGDWPRLRTQRYDLEQEPLSQGLDAQAFDLIIGANAVHAVADLRDTLRHLRTLLRPGGHLILAETVRPNAFADCLMGLLDGWWAFRDSGLRGEHVLLETGRWRELLREEGFDVAVLDGNGSPDSSCGVAVVIATDGAGAPAVPPRKPAPTATPRVPESTRPSPSPQASDPVHDLVARAIETCLAANGIHAPDRGASFSSLGADSLVAMQTCEALAARLGISVPLPLFFEHESVDRLARHLAQANRAHISQLLRPETADARP